MKKFLLYFISPVCAFALWEVLTRTAVLDARFFPAPSMIFEHLIFVSPEQGIMGDIRASLSRIVWGYSGGSLLGIILGMAMGLYRPVKTALYPLIASLYPIPKIAILPLIMLVFGIGEMSKIVVVAIGSFFLVLLNTLHGVESISRIHHDVAKVFGISRFNYIFRVILPAALPTIFTGLKLAIGYSLVIVVAAEFSGANAGIGYLIWQSWETFSIKSMYAGIVVIGILGAMFAYALELLERWLIPWRRNKP
jgi:NitT/TauT family transport system permease protein